MNKVVFITITCIFSSFNLIFSQGYETKTETHQVIESRSIYLNGGLNATFGGKSRTYLQVDLPPNTVKWYYSFSTTKGKSGTQNLNLAIQLSGMLVEPNGLTASSLSAIKVPDGVASADIYLCDRENIDKFLAKKDIYGGLYSYNMKGTVENTKQAIVEIDNISSRTVFLGLKNPSTNNGVNISIEVVAITETQVSIEKSDKYRKAEMYGDLALSNFNKGNYEKCIEYCDKAIFEETIGWVTVNKGLALMLLGKENESVETLINSVNIIKNEPNSANTIKWTIDFLDNIINSNPASIETAKEMKSLFENQR